MKLEFLNNEFWILTFGGAFQRANIYKEKYPKKTRTTFRNNLRTYVEEIVSSGYNTPVSEEKHIENIYSIVRFSEEKENEGCIIPINFGVAQKLLNLYLKYKWCLGNLKTVPPHFPVDRLVQELLNKEVKDMSVNRKKVEPWTQFYNEEKYLEVIRFAESVRDTKTDFKNLSLAEMELTLFNRRSNV